MNILILGADGYIGWPLSLYLANHGHSVTCVDNYSRRSISAKHDAEPLFENPLLTERITHFVRQNPNYKLRPLIGDLCDPSFIEVVFAGSSYDTVIHLAEQPSAPYSMMGFKESDYTLRNNLLSTHNILWAILENCPDAHLIKLGTMGEYGTPNINIEEGWLTINHEGRSDQFLYPRAAGSIYHTTKVLDTDLIYFFVRNYGLKVTDLMQGPVYGLHYSQSSEDPLALPNFHYDGLFGTVINRFIVQAVSGIPLTIYGKGGQTRGYLHLNDSLQCIHLALQNPPAPGQLKIYNQFVDTLTVNQIAELVVSAAADANINATCQTVPNPRREKEEHYYHAKNEGFYKLGLKPQHFDTENILKIINEVLRYKDMIDTSKVLPKVKW